MGFETSLEGYDEVRANVRRTGSSIIPGRTHEDLKEFAEELKEEFEDTSPVRTGEYKNSWGIREVDRNEIIIFNDAEHAPYLVFPNRRMIGSPSADRPAEGIIHNVRGILHRKSGEKQGRSILDSLLDLF